MMRRLRNAECGLALPGALGLRIFLQLSLLLALALVVICDTSSFAQKASFIYIQGDKKTPFYVKHNGQMLPRYGKNYCIIPELTAGVANIEVLFQQNAFPAQRFAIRVPESGERGFLLIEKEGAISLYDLEQKFYLSAGNTADQDRLEKRSAANAVATAPPPSPINAPPAQTLERKERRAETKEQARPIAKEKTRIPRTNPRATPPAADPSEPRFIPNLTLDTSANRTSATGRAAGGCGEPMDVKSFAALYRQVLDIADQDARLLFLNKQTGGCYSTTQLRLLARGLDRDAARYTFLKKFQSRINVAARFAELEDLLTAEAYRARFRELL